MWWVLKLLISLFTFLETKITWKIIVCCHVSKEILCASISYIVGEELNCQGMTWNLMEKQVALWNTGNGADAFPLWEGESRTPRERICGGGISIWFFFLVEYLYRGGSRGWVEKSRRFFWECDQWTRNQWEIINVSQYFPAGSFAMICSAVNKLCSVTLFACLLICTCFPFLFMARGVSTLQPNVSRVGGGSGNKKWGVWRGEHWFWASTFYCQPEPLYTVQTLER